MSGQGYCFGGWCLLTFFSQMWYLIGLALIRVNMVGLDSQRHSSTPLLAANLKEYLPGFMCLSQQILQEMTI